MKITIRLPGGGWIRYEKKPMSEDAAFHFSMALGLIGFMCFMLLLIWILR